MTDPARLEAIRQRINSGEYDALDDQRTIDDLEFLLAEVARLQAHAGRAGRLRELSRQWRSEGFDSAQYANQLDAVLKETTCHTTNVERS